MSGTWTPQKKEGVPAKGLRNPFYDRIYPFGCWIGVRGGGWDGPEMLSLGFY